MDNKTLIISGLSFSVGLILLGDKLDAISSIAVALVAFGIVSHAVGWKTAIKGKRGSQSDRKDTIPKE